MRLSVAALREALCMAAGWFRDAECWCRGADAPPLVRGDRQRLREARRHLAAADDLLCDVILSLNTRYATQEMDWQENEPGRASCRATETLRETVGRLRILEVPDGVCAKE